MCWHLSTIVLVSAAVGQAAPPPATKDSESERRLTFLTERIAQYQLFQGTERSTALPPIAEPVLRYSNPVRAIGLSDGVVSLWLQGARPAAAVSLSIRSGGEVYRELTLLAPGPLECVLEERAIWSPTDGGLQWKTLDADEPVTGKTLRLTQMRGLARRFSATYYKSQTQETFELRTLSQPVYRYEDEASGTMDGAMFVFAEANDPETLLLLEAIKGPDGDRSWRYGLARMTSVRMTVRLDNREVWSVPNYWSGPRTPSDPYLEARDGLFFNPGNAPAP